MCIIRNIQREGGGGGGGGEGRLEISEVSKQTFSCETGERERERERVSDGGGRELCTGHCPLETFSLLTLFFVAAMVMM